jgi:hypothetical protein
MKTGPSTEGISASRGSYRRIEHSGLAVLPHAVGTAGLTPVYTQPRSRNR